MEREERRREREKGLTWRELVSREVPVATREGEKELVAVSGGRRRKNGRGKGSGGWGGIAAGGNSGVERGGGGVVGRVSRGRRTGVVDVVGEINMGKRCLTVFFFARLV